MPDSPVVILISANAEWQVVLTLMRPSKVEQTPYGEVFQREVTGVACIFFQGGWGKIAAAGSTQYAIDRWQPELLINLGTCGGFAGQVLNGEIILAESTLVYDIFEQIHDPQEAITAYVTKLDLSWLGSPMPLPVRRERLISADRDIIAAEVPQLISQYQAIGADWESGAIAWVVERNKRRCLILRGVSDLVGVEGGEAYGEPSVFVSGTQRVMQQLLDSIPGWLHICGV